MVLNVAVWLAVSTVALVDCHVLRPRILRPRDTTYAANVRDRNALAGLGVPGQTTTVNAGVTYFISGQGPHSFFGNIVNNGDIVVSQTDSLLGVGGLISTPLAVTYASTGTDGVLVTSAGSLISLNDYGDVSLVSPSIYNWGLYSMVNDGTLQWCGNGQPPTGSEYTLTCITNTCINNGLITWEQYNADNGVLFSWLAGSSPISSGATPGTVTGFNPINNGAFRLINTDLQITQDVLSTTTGGGCFVLGNNGLLSLLTGTQGANTNTRTFATQSIYFSTTTAGLYITPAIYALNANFGATLYGFGRGNYIAFTEPLALFSAYSYSGSTLTVRFLSGTSIAINIGTGYTASSFSTTFQPDLLRIPLTLGAIIYNGAAPARTLPNVCQVTYPVCANPESTAGASFASTVSSTSTSSASSVTTSIPSVTTSIPSVTTSIPSVTTSIPSAITSIPSVTTSIPSVTTSIPSVTTSIPSVNTSSSSTTTTPTVSRPATISTTIGPNRCVCRPRST